MPSSHCSPHSSQVGPHDDMAPSHSPHFSSSATSSSRHSSIHPGDPDQDAPATTGTSRSPAPGNQAHPQNPMSGFGADRVPGDTSDGSFPRPITPMNVADLGMHQNQGTFKNAHNFTMTGPNFIDNNQGSLKLTNNFNMSNTFMKDLLMETIPGAAYDSSARYPPPRCHPGTRLAILERCLSFITNCNGQRKIRLVVGAAGVGKSAILQNIADSPQLPVTSNASVFFSINGRNDGAKAIMTLSYQLAVKSKLYRQVIEDQVTDNPSLLQSSMPVQFEKFIVHPFIHNPDLNTAGRVLIIIDGLDECKHADTQVDLVRLISSFCISYPSSPIVWLIASRPEPHITAFFSRPEVMPAYEKEEIDVDSDEAHADVERFLRDKLTEVRIASDSLDLHWPDEHHLWKLANAAGGLFAYAHTVMRYIGDSTVGDPVSQLSDVLNVIDEHPMPDIPREEHPMALLDALYARILSNVPSKIIVNTRRLLSALASDWDWALELTDNDQSFIVLCNWLGMTADEAYAAVNRLRSVLYFPRRHEAHKGSLKPFHKSFIDYLFRSGLSPDIKLEARKIMIQCTFRVLEESPDFGDDYDYFRYGQLARRSAVGGKIPITWSADAGAAWGDNQTRLVMYKLAIGEVVAGVKRGDSVFQSESCIKVLTTRFERYHHEFPLYELRDLVFDISRRREFMKCGILMQIPAKEVDMYGIGGRREVKLRFRRSVTKTTLPDTWNSSCMHEREGQYEQGKEQSWITTFGPEQCAFCFERFKRQVNGWIIKCPDDAVTIMFTSARACCVELRFVDSEDGVSEWTYWSWINLSTGERKRLGSNI